MTNAVAPVGSSKILTGSPQVVDEGHVLAFELISDRFPLFRSMENELTSGPAPLMPWVSTYNSPEGREEELPQLSGNKLRAHMPASATTRLIFFDICSPKGPPSARFSPIGEVNRFPSAGDALPAVTETEACG